MIICITGTPGTGKTYFARKLEKRTGFRYLDLNAMIRDEKLYEGYDRKARTYDVDVKKLGKFMDMLLKKYRYSREDGVQKNINDGFKKLLDRQITIKKILGPLKKYKNNVINNIIIDSHLSHYINSDYCVVMKSDIKSISNRLASRHYSKAKIADNIESEIFDICLEEAKALNRKIIIVNN